MVCSFLSCFIVISSICIFSRFQNILNQCGISHIKLIIYRWELMLLLALLSWLNSLPWCQHTLILQIYQVYIIADLKHSVLKSALLIIASSMRTESHYLLMRELRISPTRVHLTRVNGLIREHLRVPCCMSDIHHVIMLRCNYYTLVVLVLKICLIVPFSPANLSFILKIDLVSYWIPGWDRWLVAYLSVTKYLCILLDLSLQSTVSVISRRQLILISRTIEWSLILNPMVYSLVQLISITSIITVQSLIK